MTDWRSYTVGDLVKEKLIAPPMDGNHGEIHPKGNDFTDSGIPFVVASDINNGVIDFEECKYISKEQADGLRKGFSLEGDVLLSHKATIGRTAIVPRTEFPYLMLTPQVTYYRVLDEKVLDNRFLKYYFDSSSFQKTLGLWAGAGSTRAYLGITGQKYLPVIIPDINTQKQVADVLSATDKKIELNNKINAELEAMSKLIYDYWFVQFDFPDANGNPYKSSGGKMVYNEALKREIPDGWKVQELHSIASSIMGQSPKGKSYNHDGIGVPLLNGPADYKNGALFGRTYTTEPTRLCKKNDMVLCIRATIGNLVYSEGEFCLGRGVAAVRPDDKIYSELIYFLLNQEIERFKMHATGSIIKGITKDDLIESKCLFPDEEPLLEFHNMVKPMFDKQRKNKAENIKLIELRDWLLPMLMNGQVIVNDS